MEKERKINWLGLFIKIIIIFIFILIIIWLISKITAKTRLSDTFKNNIGNMEKVATDYFKGIDLPQEKGKSLKITLGEMIDKKLIVSANDKDGTTCDPSKSYSEITRKKNNYILSTTLKCENESSTISKKFSFKDCKNCNNQTKADDKKNNGKKSNESKTNEGNNQSNGEENNSSQTNNAVTYYEYVKETTTYTKWMKGNITGNNVENKYEYYGVASDTYYSLGVIKENEFKVGNTINYTLKVNKVPNSKYYFSKIEEASYYINNESTNYINEKNIKLFNQSYSIAKNITESSLKSNNFTYKLSPYYRKGVFYVDVEISIINTDGVISYKNGNKKIYYVPLKLNIKFASDEITENIPNGEYETITYYRYMEKNRDVIWSTDNFVEGYTKTGNYEIRS